MKSQIDTAVVHTAEIAENARDVLLNVAEATRYFTLAEAFAEATIDKQEYFQSAVNFCLRAREAAQKQFAGDGIPSLNLHHSVISHNIHQP
jgi:hypothetical protein